VIAQWFNTWPRKEMMFLLWAVATWLPAWMHGKCVGVCLISHTIIMDPFFPLFFSRIKKNL
jgi:hypothetical protein